MLPDEIYAGSASSEKFKYSHPLNHATIDDDSLRARLTYDLMTFMSKSDSESAKQILGLNQNLIGESANTDEVDIMILDGFYKEAGVMIEQRLKTDPQNEKTLFQKAFLEHLRAQYQHILEEEEGALRSNPRNVNALVNKSLALVNLEREEEALAQTEKALEIDPENITALGSKAYIAKILGKDELEEQTLAQAYNIRAKHRLEQLQQKESQLLRDFSAIFAPTEEVSAFRDFNRSSMIH